MKRNQGKPESYEQKAHEEIKQKIYIKVPIEYLSISGWGDCVGADQQARVGRVEEMEAEEKVRNPAYRK
jgi:hypothetical protein